MTNTHIEEQAEINNDVTTPSKLNYLSLLCIAIGTAFLTAAVVLILQYKQGIPFALSVSLALAVAVGFLFPMIISWLAGKLFKSPERRGYYAFIATNLLISLVLGLIIF